LLDFLDREDVAKNTIVAYVTDNGWIQDPEKPRYAPRSKQSPYDGGLRTPIMLRWPGRVTPRMSDTPVSSLDLLPTLLAASKIPAPAGLAGVNLLDDAAVTARPAVFGECFTHTAVDLHDPSSSLRWRWVIAQGWKLIVPAAKNEPEAVVELYDLTRDPTEQHNRAQDEPARVEKLRAILDAWWRG
jgi:uncharacterized sulfatase